jgi:hypothetical protein
MIATTDDCPPLPVVAGVELRHCVGFPGYAVASDGGFWSCRQYGRWIQRKTYPTNLGYAQLKMNVNGRQRMFAAHRAILIAFSGENHPNLDVRHLNGIRNDNRLENLSWGTRSENMLDSLTYGTKVHCQSRPKERNGRARLTSSDIVAIRASSDPRSELALQYGVGKSTIGHVLRGDTWKDVA